MFSGG